MREKIAIVILPGKFKLKTFLVKKTLALPVVNSR